MKPTEGEATYGRDLSYVHHVGFGELSRGVAAVLTTLLNEAGHTAGVVVDLGCGTGILAREVAAAGFEVIGVDSSPAMIAVAEAHAPDARFHVGSLHRYDVPPCVAVCAVGESLSYLGQGEARIDVRTLFARIWNALEPRGLFLFDVVEKGGGEPMSYHASRSGPDWEVVVEVMEDVERAVVTRTITTTRLDGSDSHSSTEIHRVQVFARKALEDALVECGFRVQMDDGYGAVALPPRRVGVIATKPRA